MRSHRFFVPYALSEDSRVEVTDHRLLHQWRDVFRMRKGQDVSLIEPTGGEYRATIEVLEKERAEVLVGGKKPLVPNPRSWLGLAPAVIKKDKFEWVVEKGTELGVDTFFPVLTDRVEKRNLDLARLNRIATEAAEQCGRSMVPEIHEPWALSDLLESEHRGAPVVMDQSGAEALGSTDIRDAYYLIGPEGGWSEQERTLMTERALEVRTFASPLTLRAETAAIAVPSLLLPARFSWS